MQTRNVLSSKGISWLLCVGLIFSFCVGCSTPTSAQKTDNQNQIEPNAGKWKTWVLTSATQIPVPAPPNSEQTKKEIEQLKRLAAERNAAVEEQVRYWNTGAPSYRWNQILRDEINNNDPFTGTLPSRNFALINVAIYDATVAAWHYKYQYNRSRPTQADKKLVGLVSTPNSPSYPSEYAVTAGAAGEMLAYFFPDKARNFSQKVDEAAKSRLAAGVEYQSDIDAGLELGKKVAQLVIERAKSSNYDAVFNGKSPTGANVWQGENAVVGAQGLWKPWFLTANNQFRPPAPVFTEADLKEVTEFKQTPRTRRAAMFWAVTVPSEYWYKMADRMIFEYGLTDNAPRTARIYALLGTVLVDSNIAISDAKFAYWSARPDQMDRNFKPLLTTPNHPTYPSGHATIAGAGATLMSYFFPADAAEFNRIAQEGSDSRLWGGVHFRKDNEVGMKMGRDIAKFAIERAQRDGSQ
jgi:hypothetical protein